MNFWGCRSCVVHTNEVISKIWRTNDAMSSLRSSWLYSLRHQSGCPTLPLPSLPKNFSDTTTRQRSSPQATGLSALSRRDGDASDRPGSRHPSQDGLSLVGTSCPVTPSKPKQTEVCSFIEIDELCTFIAKKNSMLALVSGRLHLWQGPRLCLRQLWVRKIITN